MTVKYSDWEKQFNGQITIAVKASEKVFYKSCDILYKNIVERTPVGDPSLWKYPAHKDYKPGTLKAGWTINKQTNIVIIENLTPYAFRVETGWSHIQAPYGMMRISVKEFTSIVDQVSKEYKI